MSQATRQSELFAGNDWLAVYKAFTEVNLNAYDFDSIRTSMTDYIRRNYPEDFNDWIESSEFIAILDLLAYLGQSLAFRMDINSRENFLSTARSRESVLRLARFLSYNARRNYPARGLAKITEVKTTHDVYDSAGRNLNNQIIKWDDANNPDWFEQWILVLNSALVQTNPFGVPTKEADILDIPTQLYVLENVPTTAGNFPFTATVNNQSLDFDVVNADFNTTYGFVEQIPSPTAKFHVIYRSDGNGNSSKDTGFFVYFKQGSLQHSDFSIDEPQENRTIFLNNANINETDLWVQTVNDDGTVPSDGVWNRVGFVPSDDIVNVVLTTENTTYNDFDPDIQNIFQAVTMQDDKVTLRFGDGRFGQIPMGNLRAWYRTSANQNLTIRPDDIQNVQITVPYTTLAATQRTLTLGFSLQETVANSVTSESNEDVRRRASRVASTQGRMVSGEDYNTLPVTTNLAIKIKAVNRLYSGQSRYIDLNDPTGTYQSTSVFGDDGASYQERKDYFVEVPLSVAPTPQELLSSYVKPIIARGDLKDFVFNYWLMETMDSQNATFPFWFPEANQPTAVHWNTRTDASNTPRAYYELGNFYLESAPNAALEFGQPPFEFVTAGAMIKFEEAGWVGVVSTGIDALNKVTQCRLSEAVKDGDRAIRYLPAFVNTLESDALLTSQIADRLNSRRSFGLGYDFGAGSWYIQDIAEMSTSSDYEYIPTTHGSKSWLLKAEYGALHWRFTSRGLENVFESERTCKFYFVNQFKSIDPSTGKVGVDTIRLLKANGLDHDIKLGLTSPYVYSDGYQEPRRVKTEFLDGNSDGLYDDPESYSAVLALNENGWLSHQVYTSLDGYEYKKLIRGLVNPQKPQLSNREYAFLIDTSGPSVQIKFYVGTDSGENQILQVLDGSSYVDFVFEPDQNSTTGQNVSITDPTYVSNGTRRHLTDAKFVVTRGINNLAYQWKHFVPSDHRIDPAITNIIDVFVLTRYYNEQMLAWRAAGANPLTMPKPPTEQSLRMSFSDLEEFKMFSDEIVWRPAKFKMLFGQTADSAYRAVFRVIKAQGSTMSDGEIKSKIVESIQEYFDVNNWEFGETFYYTELAGYIHRQLSTAISSVVIVPEDDRSFGNLFSVEAQPDEIFFPTAQVGDVEIISAFTNTNLRIR